MKIGIIDSYDSPFEELWGAEHYRKLCSFGFSAVDYNLMQTDSFLYSLTTDKEKEFTKKLSDRIHDAGMFVSQVHGPWPVFPDLDYGEESRRIRLEYMKTSIRLSALLGSKKWVIHPMFPCGVNDLLDNNAQVTWEVNLDYITELLKYAKENGVIICLENMPFKNFSLSKPKDILKFLNTIDDPMCCACLDTGHAALFDDESLADTVIGLGNKLQALHIHDNDGKTDSHWLPGEGIIDWHTFALALHDIDFQGVFSLETYPDPTPVGYEEIMRLLAKKTYQIANMAEI